MGGNTKVILMTYSPCSQWGLFNLRKIMKYTHIIWDFNGTILDDVMAGIKSVNIMLRKYGVKEIESVEAYRRAFGFPVRDYYERIGFDFSKVPYDVLAIEWVELYLEHTKEPRLMNGVDELLSFIKEKGIDQLVLSACEIEMLTSQLEQLGVKNHFGEIIGLSNIHAAGKADLARAWREKNPEARALLIGDTTHDFEVAEILGADCALYTGGHHDRERLSSCRAVVFDNFSELEEIIE